MEFTYAATPEQERAYSEIAAGAFSQYTDMGDHIFAQLKRPLYKREHARIVVDDGEVVAGVAIVELPVRYGDAVLRIGGIGAVATNPERQGRGYGRNCMQDTVDYLAADGFDISILLGIENYYHKFGYRTALIWAPLEYSVLDFEPTLPDGLKVRGMRRKDIVRMASLYDATLARCNLSVVRDDAFWKWYVKHGQITPGNTSVLVDRDENLLAYATASGRGGTMRVGELAVADSTVASEGALFMLRDRAKESFCKQVEIFTEPEGPFARFCLKRKEIASRRFTGYIGGPMLRLFNLEQLFGKIAGTLAARWRDAPRSVPTEAVTLTCPMGRVAFVPTGETLQVKYGEVVGEEVTIPDEALTEMVMGFRSVDDILTDESVSVTDGAKAVLGAVFPVSIPFLSPPDHM
jgi:predicted N-acetyltransferase YhbS